MKRIYHRYETWEEIPAGMWDKIRDEETMLKKAIEFTGNPELYGSWMLKVGESWPISSENWLTATDINRKAWIGHAAACLAIGSPEYITRRAWGYLTKIQQDLANEQAESAIRLWEQKRRLNAISEFGKRDAIQMEYPRMLRNHLKQGILFHLTEAFAGQYSKTICA